MAAVTGRLGTACISVALVALLALAGCGTSTDPGANSAPTTTSDPWSAPEDPPDPRTLLRAGTTAVAAVPDGTLTFIESEADDAGSWRVQVVTPDGRRQQLKVGADGATVLVGPSSANDSDAGNAERRTWVQAARLDYRAAVTKVLAAVPDGSITQLSLGDRNAITVWTAVVWDPERDGHDVSIDAASGELVANKQV